MYDELIKRLQDFASGTMRDEDAQLAFDAADAIEELRKAVLRLEDEGGLYDELPTFYIYPTKWIPVTERLPEERINPSTLYFEYVLCATIWGDVRPFEFGSPFGCKEPHFWHRNRLMDEYVTHWMPLPEPPEEET